MNVQLECYDEVPVMSQSPRHNIHEQVLLG